MTLSTALSPVATVAAFSASAERLVAPSSAASSPSAGGQTSLQGVSAGFRMPSDLQMVSRLAAENAGSSDMHRYPLAIRTANAFTLPCGRLLDERLSPLMECGVKKEADKDTDAAAYEALVRVVSRQGTLRKFGAGAMYLLPGPLRNLPFWQGATGRRRCIVYLEPRRNTPLYMAIERFFAESSRIFGHTEAHQYHPHSSMTGFIDIDDSVQDAQQTSGQTMVRIACQLQALMAKGFSQNHVELPRVRTVSTAYDYPHKGTHKIEINLDTPEFFRQIVEGLVKAVPQAHIRTKRMCHISLAYFNKHVKTDNLMSVEQARLLDDMARDIVYNSGFNVMDMSTNLWDVAFYELAFKSDVLSVPHKFNQIARWQL